MVFVWAWGLSAASLIAWAVYAAVWERDAHDSVGQALSRVVPIVGFVVTCAAIWLLAVVVWAIQTYRRHFANPS